MNKNLDFNVIDCQSYKMVNDRNPDLLSSYAKD